jgi:hypothetical protein
MSYLECLAGENLITNEQDTLDWIALCGENQVSGMLIHESNLTPEFFRLRTGVAGDILQRFAIYRVRLAALLSQETANQGRFREMVLETNRGNQFRVFFNRQQAENWLYNA